jgi:hypothetical protein
VLTTPVTGRTPYPSCFWAFATPSRKTCNAPQPTWYLALSHAFQPTLWMRHHVEIATHQRTSVNYNICWPRRNPLHQDHKCADRTSTPHCQLHPSCFSVVMQLDARFRPLTPAHTKSSVVQRRPLSSIKEENKNMSA